MEIKTLRNCYELISLVQNEAVFAVLCIVSMNSVYQSDRLLSLEVLNVFNNIVNGWQRLYGGRHGLIQQVVKQILQRSSAKLYSYSGLSYFSRTKRSRSRKLNIDIYLLSVIVPKFLDEDIVMTQK